MSIDEMIKTLQSFKDKLGSGKEEVPVVRINYGENDYFVPSFGLVGDFIVPMSRKDNHLQRLPASTLEMETK